MSVGLLPELISPPGGVSPDQYIIADLRRRLANLEAVRVRLGPGSINASGLAPGSITTSLIAVGAITSDLISALAINAGHIQSAVITSGHIAANTITAADIAADTITSTEIQAATIQASDIAASTITTNQIAANTITAADIAAGTITTNEIAANTITAADIAADTITATEIATNAITTNEIAATTITAGDIATGTITATQIATGTITGTLIAGTTITAANIATNTITADRLSISTLSAITANLGTITAGTITGGTFQSAAANPKVIMDATGLRAINAAGTITFSADASTGKITTLAGIGGSNELYNSRSENGTTDWTGSTATIASSTTVGGHSGLRAFAVTSTAASGSAWLFPGGPSGTPPTQRNVRPAKPGEDWTVSGWMRGSVVRATDVRLRFYDAANSQLLEVDGADTNSSTTVWNRVSATGTAPANTAYVAALFRYTPTAIGDIVYWTDLQLELGTIQTTYGPRPDEILPGTVTGNSGGAGTGSLATGTIIGTDLLANTITATQISAATITSVQIASATITAGNIAAGTITATQIMAGTITGDRIAGATILAGNLDVDNLSAISANLGAVSAGTLSGVLITGATIQTSGAGQRVVLNTSGLTAYGSDGAAILLLPTAGDPMFKGAVDAEGGVQFTAPTSSPPPQGRKAVWLDANEAEVASVFGVTNTYPGSSSQSLVASATGPLSYTTLVKNHANVKHYWKLNGAASPSGDSVAASPLALTTTGSPGEFPVTATGLIAGTDSAIKSGSFGYGYLQAAPGVAENVTTGLTLEYWFRMGSKPAGDVRLVQRAAAADGTTSEYWKSTWKGATSKVEASLLIGGVARTHTIASTLAINTTYHVVHTYDGANIRTYINAVADGTATAQTGSIDAQGTTNYRVGIIQPTEFSGPRSPTAADDFDPLNAFPAAWVNPTNALTSNNTYATVALTAIQAAPWLRVQNFGFTIPAGATILGVELQVDRLCNVATTMRDRQVYLTKTGAQEESADYWKIDYWPTSEATMSYGGAADTWGMSLTAAEVNSTSFGAMLSTFNWNSAATASVDHMRITVYYKTDVTVDEVAIYNAALTQGVISDHYQTGVTGISTSVAPVEKKIISADGTSDFASSQAVTSLPGTPYDGQEIKYLADATNGIVWHLKYRAASASAYKWEVQGGSPLYNEVPTDESIAAGAYGALATVGPSITLPLAGDYYVEHSAAMYNGTLATAHVSYDINPTAAVDADAAVVENSVVNRTSIMHRVRRKAGLSATTLVMKYKANGGTPHFLNRWMRVTPVRVG